MNKVVLLTFALVLLSTAIVVGFVRPVVAQNTIFKIFIRSDGSVEPSTAPIQRNGNLYTFTDNIVCPMGIIVERDNILLDGAGYTLDGRGSENSGIDLTGRSNVTIKNMEIRIFFNGIWLHNSSSNTISGNNITECNAGILLYKSSNNAIYGNNITNGYGIYLQDSSNNTIYGNNLGGRHYGIFLIHSSDNNLYENNIEHNEYGFWLYNSSNHNSLYRNNIINSDVGIVFFESSNNFVYHNNFINNTQQIYDRSWDDPHVLSSINTWDDGYPFGGNYWSDYAGVDSYSGLHQNETSSDGIGDTPYEIDENNQDNYPLMGMFSNFNATSGHHVTIICNSTISDFKFDQISNEISFNVTGKDGTNGFCRIRIPTALMNGTYKVFINSTEVSYTLLPFSNSKHSYLYFTYNHSTQEVIIILESSPQPPFWMQWGFWSIVIVGIAVLAGAVYFLRKRKPPTPTAPTLPTEGTLRNINCHIRLQTKTTQNTNPLNSYLPPSIFANLAFSFGGDVPIPRRFL